MIFNKLLFFLIFISMVSVNIQANCQLDDSADYIRTSAPVKGVFIVGHGLNLRPDKMIELSNFLKEEGYHIYLLKLAGHNGKEDEIKDYLSTWRDQFSQTYCVAKEKSQSLNIPVHFLGFSLSGIVGLDFMTQQNNAFDKTVLIAPAFKTNWYSELLKVLFPLGLNLKIPSQNLKDYRAKSFTYVNEYKALFKMIDNVEDSSPSIDSPLVFLHPKDELVNFKGSKDYFESLNARVIDLSNKSPKVEKSFYHLLIDSIHLGDDAFNTLKSEIISHLAN